jgi:hypothetical protein
MLSRSGAALGDNSTSTKNFDELDVLSTNSLSDTNQLNSLRLMRSRSNSSSFSNSGGYLFLAIVFCIMCCSSLISNPQSFLDLSAHVK